MAVKSTEKVKKKTRFRIVKLTCRKSMQFRVSSTGANVASKTVWQIEKQIGGEREADMASLTAASTITLEPIPQLKTKTCSAFVMLYLRQSKKSATMSLIRNPQTDRQKKVGITIGFFNCTRKESKSCRY